jgi:hypothetical protein
MVPNVARDDLIQIHQIFGRYQADDRRNGISYDPSLTDNQKDDSGTLLFQGGGGDTETSSDGNRTMGRSIAVEGGNAH